MLIPYDNPSRAWKWIGISAAVGAGVLVGLYALRASARPKPPAQPRPGDTGPLRPPPPGTQSPGIPMGPPGPLASKLGTWIADQSEDELESLRAVLPEGWWSRFVLAAQMPTDPQFLILLNPVIIDYSIMSAEDRSALNKNIALSVGPLDALALKKLVDAAKQAAQV